MGAGAVAASGSVEAQRIPSPQRIPLPSSPGMIIKKRQYPKHARHLHRQQKAQCSLSVSAPETDSEVMIPWPERRTPMLDVNDSDESLEIEEEADCSTSAPSSPRSELSSVVEVLEFPDLLV